MGSTSSLSFSKFHIIHKAGHSMLEKDIQNQLIDCTNRFVNFKKNPLILSEAFINNL